VTSFTLRLYANPDARPQIEACPARWRETFYIDAFGWHYLTGAVIKIELKPYRLTVFHDAVHTDPRYGRYVYANAQEVIAAEKPELATVGALLVG